MGTGMEFPATRGICPVCAQDYTLNKHGFLRKHKRSSLSIGANDREAVRIQSDCPGSGGPPRERK